MQLFDLDEVPQEHLDYYKKMNILTAKVKALGDGWDWSLMRVTQDSRSFMSATPGPIQVFHMGWEAKLTFEGWPEVSTGTVPGRVAAIEQLTQWVDRA